MEPDYLVLRLCLSECVGGIIGVSSQYGLPANLAIVGDVFLKSCACEDCIVFSNAANRAYRVCNV